jgi:hypothetical protein
MFVGIRRRIPRASKKAADEGVCRPINFIDKNGHNKLCPYVKDKIISKDSLFAKIKGDIYNRCRLKSFWDQLIDEHFFKAFEKVIDFLVVDNKRRGNADRVAVAIIGKNAEFEEFAAIDHSIAGINLDADK